MAASRAVATAAAAAVLGLVAATPGASAAPDPAGCTPNIAYDSSIPTFAQVAATASPPFTTVNGQSVNTLGGFQTGDANRHPTGDLQQFQQAIADATAGNPRVRVVIKDLAPTTGGRRFKIAVVGTPDHIASLEDDAAFWRGVRNGSITKDSALATLDSGDAPPAFAWITDTPHGNEPAGGEAVMRNLYELAARTDCANQRRLANLTVFVDPARNPDGRDNRTRQTAFAFDPNRDLAFQTQDIAGEALDKMNLYPGLFFIDAHQQENGYFNPPNEDPVLHEISDYALDTIQHEIGPAIQERFNDQGIQYRNYHSYDLFSNEYADSATSLFMGAAGMTYEKGRTEAYGKQVYDHYVAIDETLNITSKRKEHLSREWVKQWEEATIQGQKCELQENKLVSPLHEEISQQPTYDICGYYLKADQHSGDVARVIELLRGRDVRVYKLDAPVEIQGSHDFGEIGTKTQTLPAGSYYIPAGQPMKHWLHSAMEEDPFIPYAFFYDVVNWSFPQLFSLGGAGQLQQQIPASAQMTEVTGTASLGGVSGPGGAPVLAFATDSSKALGLVTQLLDGGATVYRGTQAFDAGGKHFPTGTALVDASTLGPVNIQALSVAAQTPVTGIANYPVPRYQLDVPKIALYTGATTVPANPVFSNGHCPTNTAGVAFCEMVYGTARNLKIPLSRIIPFTSTELAAGNLVTGGFTAFINPNQTIAAGAGATALQAFVNGGGNYVSYNNNGTTSARNAGLTTLDTSPTNVPPFNAHCPDSTDPTSAGSLTTPGTAFNAEFNTASPAAWGFDEGAYIYRNGSGDSVFDPTKVGTGLVAVKYPTALKAFGYECNATDTGALPGRPYVVTQPFGAGNATIIGSNVFFRGWTAGALRLVMNGVLMPGASDTPATPKQSADPKDAPVLTVDRKPLSKAELAKRRPTRNSPVKENRNQRLLDVTVVVPKSKATALRSAVNRANLPKAVRKRVKFTTEGKYFKLTIKDASKFARAHVGDPKLDQLWVYGDLEMRPGWAWSIIKNMVRRNIKPISERI